MDLFDDVTLSDMTAVFAIFNESRPLKNAGFTEKGKLNKIA